MKFNSQICTSRSQSERLLALGLKVGTADICIRPDNTLIIIRENSFIYNNLGNAIQAEYCPAWSLHRLIELSNMGIMDASTDNIYDKVIQYIKFLIKCGVFNKEYLEGKMKQYRKKPVIIEAIQFIDDVDRILEIQEFSGGETIRVDYKNKENPTLKINTLEGMMTASVCDYIIKGVQGEFYPCKPDVFEQTYEEIDNEAIYK